MRKIFGICMCLLLLGQMGGCGNTKSSVDSEMQEDGNFLSSEVNSLQMENGLVEASSEETSQEQQQNGSEPEVEPLDTDYVKIQDYIPDIIIDLKYATEDNFTGEVIYSFHDAYLRYGTVKKLAQAQEKLKQMGYCIKIWDAYRPFSAQEKLWEVCPNPRYVANPANGMKAHNLGGTIDMTIVYCNGDEVEMPTGFDDFSLRADREYFDVSERAAENSRLLEFVMTECGFKGYSGEWWDYSDTTKYDALEFEP